MEEIARRLNKSQKSQLAAYLNRYLRDRLKRVSDIEGWSKTGGAYVTAFTKTHPKGVKLMVWFCEDPRTKQVSIEVDIVRGRINEHNVDELESNSQLPSLSNMSIEQQKRWVLSRQRQAKSQLAHRALNILRESHNDIESDDYGQDTFTQTTPVTSKGNAPSRDSTPRGFNPTGAGGTKLPPRRGGNRQGNGCDRV